jgi:hypothetical protein
MNPRVRVDIAAALGILSRRYTRRDFRGSYLLPLSAALEGPRRKEAVLQQQCAGSVRGYGCAR